MANLGSKNGVYHIRFRFRGREYKKSLRTRIASDARAALHIVEQSLYRLLVGQLEIPIGVNPGDFILSGGTLREAPPEPAPPPPTTRQLVAEYLAAQQNLLSPNYHSSQQTHFRNLERAMGELLDLPCDHITFRDLDHYLKQRLASRHPHTCERERITILQFFKWVVQQAYLTVSPAQGLLPIKGGEDRAPFRTAGEIEGIIRRGGLTQEEEYDVWEGLYLRPSEIAGLLATVQANSTYDFGFLLHAIPAYTGMRRGEVLRLRWIDLDLEGNCLHARSRKQSRRRTETVRPIDLHPELKLHLIEWRRQRPRGQYVLYDQRTLEPLDPDRANRAFWKPMRGTPWCLCNKRDLFKVGFHTYRHSFASNLAAAGVDQRVIDEFMGHQTEAMRKRYRHLYPQQLRAAITSFSLQPVA